LYCLELGWSSASLVRT